MLLATMNSLKSIIVHGPSDGIPRKTTLPLLQPVTNLLVGSWRSQSRPVTRIRTSHGKALPDAVLLEDSDGNGVISLVINHSVGVEATLDVWRRDETGLFRP